MRTGFVVVLLLLSSSNVADAAQGRNSLFFVAADNATASSAMVRAGNDDHSNELVHRVAVHHEEEPSLRAVEEFNPYHRRRLATQLIWEQRGPTIVGRDRRGPRFRPQMSADISRIVFTMDGYDDDPVTVRVVEFNSASQTWIPLGQDFIGLVEEPLRGYMAISGDGTTLALLFDQGGSSDSRRVRLYRYDPPTLAWNQIGQDIIALESWNGLSRVDILLSFDGETVAIHDPSDPGESVLLDEPPGVVQVFSLSSGAWVQLGSNIDGGTGFGRFQNLQLSLDGRMLGLVGHDIFFNTFARVFDYIASNGVWVQRDLVIGSRRRGVNAWSADLSTVVVGKTVFQYDGPTSQWSQVGNDIPTFKTAEVARSSDGSVLALASRRTGTYGIHVFSLIDGTWQPISQEIIVTRIDLLKLSSDGTRIAVVDDYHHEICWIVEIDTACAAC